MVYKSISCVLTIRGAQDGHIKSPVETGIVVCASLGASSAPFLCLLGWTLKHHSQCVLVVLQINHQNVSKDCCHSDLHLPQLFESAPAGFSTWDWVVLQPATTSVLPGNMLKKKSAWCFQPSTTSTIVVSKQKCICVQCLFKAHWVCLQLYTVAQISNGVASIEDHLIEVCTGVDGHVRGFYDLCCHRDALSCQAYLEIVEVSKTGCNFPAGYNLASDQ